MFLEAAAEVDELEVVHSPDHSLGALAFEVPPVDSRANAAQQVTSLCVALTLRHMRSRSRPSSEFL